MYNYNLYEVVSYVFIIKTQVSTIRSTLNLASLAVGCT